MTNQEIRALGLQVEALVTEHAQLQAAYDSKTQEMVDAKSALAQALADIQKDFKAALTAAPAARSYAELGPAIDTAKAAREAAEAAERAPRKAPVEAARRVPRR